MVAINSSLLPKRSATGGSIGGIQVSGPKRATQTRSLKESKASFQQSLLDKEFGKGLTQRIAGSSRTGSLSGGFSVTPAQMVDAEGIDKYYDKWTQDLEGRIARERIPTSGAKEILKQGRESPYAQAARLREDKRYGIDTSRYYSDSKSSGGTRRRTAYFDIRKSLISNAQTKQSMEEQRMTQESKEKEDKVARSKVQGGGGRPLGRLSILSALGSNEGRYGGL